MRLVVDDEERSRHGRSLLTASRSGNRIVIRVPRRRCAGLSAWIVPPMGLDESPWRSPGQARCLATIRPLLGAP